MRCLECNRVAGEDARRCPYCGSALLSAVASGDSRDLAAHARSIWDDSGPLDKVVYLPQRQRAAYARWHVLDTLVWTLCWALAALGLDVADRLGTWIALVVAVACNQAVLQILDSPPWWGILLRPRAHDDAESQPPRAEASNM